MTLNIILKVLSVVVNQLLKHETKMVKVDEAVESQLTDLLKKRDKALSEGVKARNIANQINKLVS